MKDVVEFKFDERTADVFEDMINRSVPGYQTIIRMMGVLAEKYVQSGTNVFDLGCSLGAGTKMMAKSVGHTDARFIGVDNSEAMVERCRKGCESDGRIAIQQADIQDVEIQNASMVVMNFTLQFIPREERGELIRRICDGLNPGGILVLSEKIAFEDALEQATQEKLYYEFKSLQGYSDLEISQKRTALENVLIPESLPVHRSRLSEAGFKSLFVWFQCFNFCSMVAVKS